MIQYDWTWVRLKWQRESQGPFPASFPNLSTAIFYFPKVEIWSQTSGGSIPWDEFRITLRGFSCSKTLAGRHRRNKCLVISFDNFSSEIFGDSPFSSPFLVTFPVMNFAIHYIHHRFWWLSCHLFCHFDISLSFYLFWPFFRWPFRQPYKFITIFGASLVTFFVLIFFLPFYSPFLGDFFGDRSFYPTHLSVSLLLCLRGSVKEFKTFFSSILAPFPTRVHKFLSVVYLVVLPPIMF